MSLTHLRTHSPVSLISECAHTCQSQSQSFLTLTSPTCLSLRASSHSPVSLLSVSEPFHTDQSHCSQSQSHFTLTSLISLSLRASSHSPVSLLSASEPGQRQRGQGESRHHRHREAFRRGCNNTTFVRGHGRMLDRGGGGRGSIIRLQRFEKQNYFPGQNLVRLE